MAQLSIRARFKHFPAFKGVLFFTEKSVEKCCVISKTGIVGMGYLMTSKGGKEFKVLFASEDQKGYASRIQNISGCVKLTGYYFSDNVYVTGISCPPTRAMMANKLHRIREAQERDKAAPDKMFTGQHRSGDEQLPSILGNLQVKLAKPVIEPVKDVDVWDEAPKRKTPKKREKREKDDFELEKEREQRIANLNAFEFAKKQVKTVGMKWALMDSGYNFDDIEKFQKMLTICTSYMSHKAYR